MEVEFPIDLESRWVDDGRIYEVVFWTKLNEPEPPLVPLMAEEPHRLHGVDSVAEVLAWAEEHANGRSIVVYAEVNRGPSRGLVRLHGTDPTRAKATSLG